MSMSPENLAVLADMTVRLLELRQNECKHLVCRGQRADTVRKAGRQLSGCSGERSAHHGKGGERHEQG
ncbi:hypothetical protein [Pseudomonas aeruginosa]|uniref:hypothetical protein n=1 Tax=Pseudomonas aeruginosa TaxID=287 RepID=UPI003AAFA62D